MKHSLNFSLLILMLILNLNVNAQHSVARKWNEINLEAIRNDFARPTVHARNLFHISAAMFDAWAIFNSESSPYLIGNTVHEFDSPFQGFNSLSGTNEENMEKAISYAACRLLQHRYSDSPQAEATLDLIDELFASLGLDPSFTSTDYTTGSSAALGNYIASEYIKYGLQDGSNEVNGYVNKFYQPVNPPLFPEEIALDSIMGNPTIEDPNRWQPLEFSTFIDQSGEITESAIPDFLSPEWGIVRPFSLVQDDLTVFNRDGFDYWVYHDPGPPPYHNPENNSEDTELYQWNFSLVAIWSGHLDANLSKEINISPASIGNYVFSDLPSTFTNQKAFYSYIEGGDASQGHSVNPFTNQPYENQIVKLGDYGRVLAEFWADGPDSETPPGHWFTLLNYVSDRISDKKFNGQGETLSNLEWDIKTYFLLGGAMHDVAITSWGIKGWYDYIRPISAIRFMADLGQSTDPDGVNYNIGGLPLVEGYIEQVTESDPVELRGKDDKNIGKIKLFSWRGPGSIEDPFIPNPETDVAGVGWILAEQWWPYQRPTFITPPFAGYVSGHSTYSRAAAELMTLMTGSPFFPNGLGEFDALKNEFLVFEEGPSSEIKLQWATYTDASDQCSLSRIWGGIHPPADDINGRIIGYNIGIEAYEYGIKYFSNTALGNKEIDSYGLIYPNPVDNIIKINLPNISRYNISFYDFNGKKVYEKEYLPVDNEIDVSNIKSGKYIVIIEGSKWRSQHYIIKN